MQTTLFLALALAFTAGPIIFFAWVAWDRWKVSREYREEHDL